MRSEKNLSDQQISANLDNLSSAELATLRTRLQSAVAIAIANLRRAGSVYGKVEALISEADGFFYLDKFNSAYRALRKALDLAVKYQLGQYANRLSGMFEFCKEQLKDEQEAKPIEQVQKGLELLSEYASEEAKSSQAVTFAIQLKNESTQDRQDSLVALRELFFPIESIKSNKARILMARAMWLDARFMSDFKLEMALQKMAIEEFYKAPHLRSDHQIWACFESASASRCLILIHLGHESEALLEWDKFEGYVKENNISLGHTHSLRRARILFFTKIGIGSDSEVLALMHHLIHEIQSNPNSELNQPIILLQSIETLLILKRYEWGLKIAVSLSAKALTGRVSNQFLIAAMIHQLFLHSAIEDWDSVDLIIRRIRHISNTRNTDKEPVNIICKAFRYLSRSTGIDLTERSGEFMRLLNETTLGHYGQRIKFQILVDAILAKIPD